VCGECGGRGMCLVASTVVLYQLFSGSNTSLCHFDELGKGEAACLGSEDDGS
jgi:hypothetical protein